MSEPNSRHQTGRGIPTALGIALMVAFVGVGFAAGWFLHSGSTPEAESVARNLGALMEGPHPPLEQDDDAREMAMLYAEDALAVDATSGYSARGRDQIANGWQYMLAQGGEFTTDHVLADDRWVALVTTWTMSDAEGAPNSTPMVMLLEVRDGLIVYELDVYDAERAQV
jgi:hypothetical protein